MKEGFTAMTPEKCSLKFFIALILTSFVPLSDSYSAVGIVGEQVSGRKNSGAYAVAEGGGGGGNNNFHDCNQNGYSDSQDISSGSSEDVNINGVPDECSSECDTQISGLLLFHTLESTISNMQDINADGILWLCFADGTNVVWPAGLPYRRIEISRSNLYLYSPPGATATIENFGVSSSSDPVINSTLYLYDAQNIRISNLKLIARENGHALHLNNATVSKIRNTKLKTTDELYSDAALKLEGLSQITLASGINIKGGAGVSVGQSSAIGTWQDSTIDVQNGAFGVSGFVGLIANSEFKVVRRSSLGLGSTGVIDSIESSVFTSHMYGPLDIYGGYIGSISNSELKGNLLYGSPVIDFNYSGSTIGVIRNSTLEGGIIVDSWTACNPIAPTIHLIEDSMLFFNHAFNWSDDCTHIYQIINTTCHHDGSPVSCY